MALSLIETPLPADLICTLLGKDRPRVMADIERGRLRPTGRMMLFSGETPFFNAMDVFRARLLDEKGPESGAVSEDLSDYVDNVLDGLDEAMESGFDLMEMHYPAPFVADVRGIHAYAEKVIQFHRHFCEFARDDASKGFNAERMLALGDDAAHRTALA
jgi:hypothetical protein